MTKEVHGDVARNVWLYELGQAIREASTHSSGNLGAAWLTEDQIYLLQKAFTSIPAHVETRESPYIGGGLFHLTPQHKGLIYQFQKKLLGRPDEKIYSTENRLDSAIASIQKNVFGRHGKYARIISTLISEDERDRVLLLAGQSIRKRMAVGFLLRLLAILFGSINESRKTATKMKWS